MSLPSVGGDVEPKRKGFKKALSKVGRTFSLTRSSSSATSSSATSARIAAGGSAAGSQVGSVASTPRDSRDGEEPLYSPHPSSTTVAALAREAERKAESAVGARLAALAEERERLAAANARLAAELEAARETARDLHSRASVAEDSRSVASQTLLNLTQRAAVLEAEKQALFGELMKHTEGLKEAESPQRSENSREVVEQEANEALFSLTEELAGREAEVGTLRASEAALQEEVRELEARLAAEVAAREQQVAAMQAAEAEACRLAGQAQAADAELADRKSVV